jgi:hypothetical protein
VARPLEWFFGGCLRGHRRAAAVGPYEAPSPHKEQQQVAQQHQQPPPKLEEDWHRATLAYAISKISPAGDRRGSCSHEMKQGRAASTEQ